MMDEAALIVLEGPEGVGKSTQVRLLCATFASIAMPCLAVREPGGTSLGNAVRDLLLDPRWTVDVRAEALLFMASRAQLVQDVIRPTLARGTQVVADRFFLSTYAYQVAGRGLAEEAVRDANRLATNDLVPDLTILLNLPPSEGLRRAAARGSHDRMESLGDEFHQRVGAAFADFATAPWQAAHPECGPIVRVDATGEPAVVASRIQGVIASSLPRTLTPVTRSAS